MNEDTESNGHKGVKTAAHIGTIMSLTVSPVLALLVSSYIDQSNGYTGMTAFTNFLGFVPDYQTSRDLLFAIVGISLLTLIFRVYLYILESQR